MLIYYTLLSTGRGYSIDRRRGEALHQKNARLSMIISHRTVNKEFDIRSGGGASASHEEFYINVSIAITRRITGKWK